MRLAHHRLGTPGAWGDKLCIFWYVERASGTKVSLYLMTVINSLAVRVKHMKKKSSSRGDCQHSKQKWIVSKIRSWSEISEPPPLLPSGRWSSAADNYSSKVVGSGGRHSHQIIFGKSVQLDPPQTGYPWSQRTQALYFLIHRTSIRHKGIFVFNDSNNNDNTFECA